MKAIIVRHAETTENAKTLNVGHDNKALLTAHGIWQAKKLGEYLRREKISHAYTSSQPRAVHTTEEILKHHPAAKMTHVDELRERRLGVYESVPKHVWKEIKEKAKEAFHLFRPKGGESYTDLQARAKSFFNELIHKHENDTVLIVSHGGTLGVLLLDILEKELTEENYRAHQPKNTEFTIIEITEGQKKIHTINNRAHFDLEL